MFQSKDQKYARFWRILQNAPNITNARNLQTARQYLQDVLAASQGAKLANKHRVHLQAEASRIWQQRLLNARRRAAPRPPPAVYRPIQSRNNAAANRLVREAAVEVMRNKQSRQRRNAEWAVLQRRFDALKR